MPRWVIAIAGHRSNGPAPYSRPIRVLLDTTFARRAPLSGTGVYLERLAAELARLDGVELVTVANERRRRPAGGGAGSVRNLLTDRSWLATELPREAARVGAEVIHHPLPAGARAPGVAQVVTVHDLAFERAPELFARGFRTYAHRTHRAAARTAGAVICVSETTAADVAGLWQVPRDRIVVAPHGPGQQLEAARPPDERARAGRRRAEPGYFLYVGDDEPRKNLPTLLVAYAAYRHGATGEPLELVLAGTADVSVPGVRAEHGPGRERLAELYAGAVALVHPSLYEGFGLTVLEAMSLGTPVIAARAPGVVDVAGDAALYADPHDPDRLAAAMAELAASAELRNDLSERGQRRAAQFSWTASARAHVAAYSLALRNR